MADEPKHDDKKPKPLTPQEAFDAAVKALRLARNNPGGEASDVELKEQIKEMKQLQLPETFIIVDGHAELSPGGLRITDRGLLYLRSLDGI